MKNLLLFAIISLPTVSINALDHPYYCGVSILCGENCNQVSVTCQLSGTVSYPTHCEYYIVDYVFAECRVIDSTSGTTISHTRSSCSGCENGSGNACIPGSGAWWVGCDPLAT